MAADPTVGTLLGHPLDPGTTLADLAGAVHPDDVEVLVRAVETLMAQQDGTVDGRLRLPRGPGTWREVAITVAASAAGEPPAVRVEVHGTSDRAGRDGDLGALVDLLPLAAGTVGADGRFSAVNQDLCDLLGYAADELLTRSPVAIAHPDDRSVAEWTTTAVRHDAMRRVHVPLRFLRADGLVVETAATIAGSPSAGSVLIQLAPAAETVSASPARVSAVDEPYRSVVESVTDVIFQTDADLQWTFLNAAWTQATGRAVADSLGTSALDLVQPDDRAHVIERSRALLAGESDGFVVDVRAVRPDGSVRLVEVMGHPVVDAEGERVGVAGIITDVAERRATEQALREERDLARAVVHTAGCMVLLLYADGRIERFNRAAELVSGRSAAEAEGMLLWDVFPSPGSNGGLREVLSSLPVDGATQAVDVPWATAEGEVRVISWSATLLGADGGEPLHVVATGLDVTERRAAEAELAFQAFHDPLTGLPNRTLLMERLGHALTRLDRGERELALLFLDLNHFKIVNDTFGHDAGDRLLVAVANRIHTVLRPSDTVARFGGDEFVILCEELVDGGDAIEIADRVIGVLEAPFRLGDRDVTVTTSIGVALASHSGDDPDVLLRDADEAMYRAKEEGSARAAEPLGTRRRLGSRAPDETDLRKGMMRGEVQLVYQPQVALPEGRIVAVEALVRWHHPHRGVIQPGAFLPLAESSGLIVPLGAHILELACTQAASWSADYAGRPPLVVSVNLSRRELADESLRRSIEQILDRTGADPRTLRVEVTEPGIFRRPDTLLRALRSLRELGMQISIDDVGTAVASLSYLEAMPIDEVKVDRTIVRDMTAEGEGEATVAAVVRMAHELDLRTVAEGVEHESQLTTLRSLGCDVGQGFYFAGPQPADVITRLLEPDLRWPTDVS